MRNLKSVPKSVPPAWLEAIDAWEIWTGAEGAPKTTRDTRRQHLQHLARRVEPGPWDLTGHDLRVFFHAQTWAAETRRCRKQTLVVFYEWAIGQGLTDVSPAVELPKMRPGRPNPMPTPEPVVTSAYREATEREVLMLNLLEHGLRRGEVALVHSDDLMPDLTGTSLLVHGKGAKERVVPLAEHTAALLARQPAGWLFPGRVDGHLSPRYVGRLLADLFEGDWTAHKMRHRAARDYHDASGHDLPVVQELLGHESIETTRRYIPVTTDRLREVVQKAVAA